MFERAYPSLPLRALIADCVGGGTPSRQEPSYWRGSIPWASVKDFPEQSGVIADTEERISSAGLSACASRLIPPGTPLVCTRMAVGRSALTATAMAINQDVKALYPAAGVSAAYLLKLLQFVRPIAESRAVGSTVKGIRIQDLLNIEVPFVDEHEQALIVGVLDTCDAAIQKTEALIDNLKAIKQGLLHDLLTRGIDANGRLRPPRAEAPQLYRESPLGWIPLAWEVCRLDECACVSSGVTLGRSLSGPGVVELPYLRVANVQDGYVELSDVKTVRIFASELERFALADGDVLMNEGGDFDKLGRGTVWRAQIDPCLHQNHVFRVRCDRSVLLPDFLAAYSASQRGKTFFIMSSKQSTNLASINSTQLKGFPIARPALDEQGKIVERLDATERLILCEEKARQNLLTLKSALMDDLLTGRVRVTPLLAKQPTERSA